MNDKPVAEENREEDPFEKELDSWHRGGVIVSVIFLVVFLVLRL